MRTRLHQFDQHFILLVQQAPDWVRPIMLFASCIGHPVFVIATTIFIIVFGWLKSNTRLLVSGIGILTIFYIGSLMKLFFHRDRPLTEYVALMRFDTYSFPSGHTLGSTLAYGLLAYLAWHALPQPWNYIVVALLTIVIILVGISRVYLGAHFPSDVVGGWLLGAAGVLVVILIVQPKI